MVKVSSAFLFLVGIVILFISVFGVVMNQYWLTVYVCVIGMILVIISALTNAIGCEADVVDSDGRAVLITGCDEGFGHELAQKFNSVGFKVFAGCLNPDEGGGLQMKLDSGGRIFVFKMDVTSEESVEESFKIVAALLKKHVLWCVINNAGIAEQSLIEFTPVDAFRRHLDVNTLGPVRVSKTFLPMLRRSRGRIINIVSMAGRDSPWCLGAYSASKFALIGFSNALRREVAQFGVKVITIEPTKFKTNIMNADFAIDLNKKYWRQASEDLKAYYGEKFYKSSLKLYKIRNMLAIPDLSYVIDDVMDAAVSYAPKTAYSTGPYTKRFMYWIMQFLPIWLQDSFAASNAPDEKVAANTYDNT